MKEQPPHPSWNTIQLPNNDELTSVELLAAVALVREALSEAHLMDACQLHKVEAAGEGHVLVHVAFRIKVEAKFTDQPDS